MTEKKKMGRPSSGKVWCRYTLSKEVAEYINSLPDGERSKFVDDLLARGIAELKRLKGKAMSDFKWTQAKEIKRDDIVRLNGIGDIEVEHVVVGNEVIITAKSDWKPGKAPYKPSTRYSFEPWQEIEVKQ